MDRKSSGREKGPFGTESLARKKRKKKIKSKKKKRTEGDDIWQGRTGQEANSHLKKKMAESLQIIKPEENQSFADSQTFARG